MKMGLIFGFFDSSFWKDCISQSFDTPWLDPVVPYQNIVE
ncbi:uncharacterized protein [Blastocystis hominis]|uniref:Uncharacterized protein n=1 Tax=Blastocystis hominis TaxID=12968 RepID=D8M7B9_BLAHO|nr:uncharacterized protein [Blastocystis hominis]CBK23958.2 unnamed protein product [Blastocystis hominis]|eukprot:XP_012898006.1 uncharacterized protein [Blastocystis hominis]